MLDFLVTVQWSPVGISLEKIMNLSICSRSLGFSCKIHDFLDSIWREIISWVVSAEHLIIISCLLGGLYFLRVNEEWAKRRRVSCLYEIVHKFSFLFFSDFIKTTYDTSLDSQISLLPLGFSSTEDHWWLGIEREKWRNGKGLER